MMGYTHPDYAASLAAFGTPRHLSRCDGWILVRDIAGVEDRDAMGCYPLFCCRDWSQLARDLEEIGDDLVTVTIVTDPFGVYDERGLRQCFPDLVTPFKRHHLVDLSDWESAVTRHHRRNVTKALQQLHVDRDPEPEKTLDDWMRLYDTLIRRRGIRGISTFSRAAFAQQLTVPGIVVFKAVHHGLVVGMVLWYANDTVGYYHLAAYSELGYELGASFALFWTSAQYFAERNVRWLTLGAAAGTQANPGEGLNRFKQGWSTSTREVFLCGRILNRSRYEELVAGRTPTKFVYFPEYRAGEP